MAADLKYAVTIVATMFLARFFLSTNMMVYPLAMVDHVLLHQLLVLGL